MLLRRSAPRPSPRTTPSSPVRTIRAPAAAEASSRSCAREIVAADRHDAADEAGRDRDRRARHDAVRRARADRARSATRRDARRAGPAPCRRRSGRAAAAAPCSRASALLRETSARRWKSSRSRASSSRFSRAFSVARAKRSADRVGRRRAAPARPPGPRPRAAPPPSGSTPAAPSRAGRAPAPAPRASARTSEHGREHEPAPAGIDGGDLDARVGESHGSGRSRRRSSAIGGAELHGFASGLPSRLGDR